MTDITRRRGDTYPDEFVIQGANGLPVNITGSTFFLTLDPGSAPTSTSSRLYQLAGVVTDAAGGRVEFAPNDAQADHTGVYFFNLLMIDSLGRRRTIVSGKYTYV